MDWITPNDIRDLVEKSGRWCVSMYMPAVKSGNEVRQNPLRFRNMLRKAEDQLKAGGLRKPEVESLLDPVRRLDDSRFWSYQEDGLACFLADDFMRFYRLPLVFDELVVVTDRFHVKPLLPMLSGDGRFFILALSQNEVRLLQGSRNSVSDIQLRDVPPNIAEALKYDDPERQLQYHTGTGTKTGQRRPAVFHGHGVGKDDTKDNIVRYCRQIDDGLQEILGRENAPLILSGVEYLLSIFRDVSTYRNIADQAIPGNPEEMSPAELHGSAWSVIGPYFLRAKEEEARRYKTLSETEQVSHDITKVVPSAYYGKVETLFVPRGEQQWGAFDPERNIVYLHAERETNDEDMLDFAAVHTFVNGGTVYVVDRRDMPDNPAIAAIYRY